MISAADPCGLAGLANEFVRIGRAAPVVLGCDFIKYGAVTTGGSSGQAGHSRASVMGGNVSHVTCWGAAGALHAGLSGLSPPLTLGHRRGNKPADAKLTPDTSTGDAAEPGTSLGAMPGTGGEPEGVQLVVMAATVTRAPVDLGADDRRAGSDFSAAGEGPENSAGA